MEGRGLSNEDGCSVSGSAEGRIRPKPCGGFGFQVTELQCSRGLTVQDMRGWRAAENSWVFGFLFFVLVENLSRTSASLRLGLIAS